MSGRPYTYSREMAIVQLMRDYRRPVIKQLANNKLLRTVYLFDNQLFVSYSDTIDWVPKLSRLTRFGREEHFIWPDKPESEEPYLSWGNQIVEPIAGWPTEQEIQDCIKESAERERQGGNLSTNDMIAAQRLMG